MYCVVVCVILFFFVFFGFFDGFFDGFVCLWFMLVGIVGVDVEFWEDL